MFPRWVRTHAEQGRVRPVHHTMRAISPRGSFRVTNPHLSSFLRGWRTRGFVEPPQRGASHWGVATLSLVNIGVCMCGDDPRSLPPMKTLLAGRSLSRGGLGRERWQVFPDLGLCVSLYEILAVEGGTVYQLDGAATFSVTFSMVSPAKPPNNPTNTFSPLSAAAGVAPRS